MSPDTQHRTETQHQTNAQQHSDAQQHTANAQQHSDAHTDALRQTQAQQQTAARLPEGIRIGNAPVSYGVYGEGAGGDGTSPEALLKSMAEAGYQGSELGPPGFFGTPEETAELFASYGLAPVGAYIPVHYALDDDVVAHDMARMAQTCRELAACAEKSGLGADEAPLAILADEGSEALLHNPARAWDDRSLALDPAGWERLAELSAKAVELAKSHGLRTSFHPHISTFIESPWEVDRLLELTEVGVTLDIAHIQLAGGDPVECLDRWRDRINHVHVKDVEVGVLTRAKDARRTDFDVWWADVCVPFGRGDVDIDPFIADLLRGGYRGWLLVEQDRAPTPAHLYPQVAAEQAANLTWLAGKVAART
ncbi:sugar phosphate isomerase/epimerase family protein [Yinghuangia sp. YIM S09857]|uniref:sugar phosphate isomerase/epimerase family protein n=1 Tax=Yinghuangia sp. YIM S09857 TaxID=3436929 RepID=UPI003F52DDB4